jgi:hypothetical protein
MQRFVAGLSLAALALFPSRTLLAQSDLGLPAHHQSNLMAVARSPLYFQPWVPAGEGSRLTVALDYANVYELTDGSYGGAYVQDLEVGTLRVTGRKELTPGLFLTADLPVSVAWEGGLDGFLGWWHDLLGIEIPERDYRPENDWAYGALLADGGSFSNDPAAYLGDLQAGLGWRLTPHAQLLGTLTLPTTTREGYGRRVVTAGAMLTLWTDLDPRVRAEASAGIGFAPRSAGPMEGYQRTMFGSAGGGFRWRFYKQASVYGTFWVHSPYYEGTGFRTLDRNDVAFDFGWIFRTPGGAEWRFGMTEDPQPSGPGVDAIFKASRSW